MTVVGRTAVFDTTVGFNTPSKALLEDGLNRVWVKGGRPTLSMLCISALSLAGNGKSILPTLIVRYPEYYISA